jgi:membrane-bound lytic murein transglycosylase D
MSKAMQRNLLAISVGLFLLGGLGFMNCGGPAVKTRAFMPQRESARQAEEFIRKKLLEAESLYASGVDYLHGGELNPSKVHFEAAFASLCEIDLGRASREQRKLAGTIFSEIKSDYKESLRALGLFSEEGFAEVFEQTFQSLETYRASREFLAQRLKPEEQQPVYDIPIEFNRRVEEQIRYFQTDGRKRFETYLARSRKYKDLMQEIFAEKGLPKDLFYLALIESGFNPHAYSYARAVGPWQFIASTAKIYGLKSNWWYDERRDFEKSTRAACDYLQKAYQEFGTWPLALAAYNGGEGRVRRQIQLQRTEDFWELHLRRQTQTYVPTFMAATIIAKSPEKYGFYVEYEDPIDFEVVEVHKCVHFKKIAEAIDCEYEELKELNPELLRDVTPPNYPNYELRVPVGKSNIFAARYDTIPEEEKASWVRHQVSWGETVSSIARRYGVSTYSIMAVNNLSRKARIYAGNYLLIPTASGRSVDYEPPKGERVSKTGYASGTQIYTVRRGDTLWEIAQKHGTTVDRLCSLNGMGSRSRIYPGQKIAVPGLSSASGGVHKVRRGDTLWSIAQKYGMTVEEICQANSITANTRIYPGQSLDIPTSQTTSASVLPGSEFVTYVVKAGDTLWDIAKSFNTTINQIMRDNDVRNSSRLMPGQELRIKKVD